MNWDPDLFDLFRAALATVCAIYTIVRTGSIIWHWHLYLSPDRRETGLLRRYLLVHLLRLRVGRFAADLLEALLLLVVLTYLLYLHYALGVW